MLNARLTMVMTLIESCDYLCDIGSDHGYLPIEALKTGRIRKAQIVELNSKPLSIAYENVKKEQLLEDCSFFLSDGLNSVDEEVGNAVICGMGFDTIVHIITRDLDRFKTMNQIVLQSNSKVSVLRKEMSALGFELMDERFIIDRKLPYIALKYRYNKQRSILMNQELYLGPFLMKEASNIYLDYCIKRLNYLKSFPEVFRKNHEVDYLSEFLHSKGKV